MSLTQKLDRENMEPKQFDILVKASENCTKDVVQQTLPTNEPYLTDTEEDSSLLWVRIKVTDINDHGPIFTHKEYTIGVIFDKDIGTAVLSLAVSFFKITAFKKNIFS